MLKKGRKGPKRKVEKPPDMAFFSGKKNKRLNVRKGKEETGEKL